MDVASVQRLADDRPEALLPPRARARPPGSVEILDVMPCDGGGGLAVGASTAELLVIPVAEGVDAARRAVAGDGVWAGVLRAIGDGARRGFSSRPLRPVPPSGAERAIDTDQSNDSAVVGDAAVVKLYVRTSLGPQPGLDLPAHLAAVGFTETPAPMGSLVWTDVDGHEALVASAASYLPGARDGWEWYPELVLTALDGHAGWGPATEAAASLGGLTGRLHRALATPSEVLPDPVGRADAATWAEDAASTLDEALALTGGDEGDRLRAMAPTIAGVFERFRTAGEVAVMRIHGDLHVGQVLRWDGGLAVGDLDGNPLAPIEARVARHPPARDVAAMARAIDHVGRVVQRRRPGRDADLRAWISDARGAFLDAYRVATEPGSFDERLLLPFEVAQECHEYVYAARYLPRWRYVPDLAMPDLLAAIA
jgi:maltokinase